MTMTESAAFYEPPDRIALNAEGRIIDFLEPKVSRANTPEERVRQTYIRNLHYDYGYAKNVMRCGAPISIGSETRQADIVVYATVAAASQRDQARIRLIVETKAPNEKSGIGQLKSYIFASSAHGGVWVNQTDTPRYFRQSEGQLEEWPNIPRADESWDSIGSQTKAKLRPPHNLVDTFKRCHNALYKVGIDSDDLAMDMMRIILAKYQDETNEGDAPEFRVTPLELQAPSGRKGVADRVRTLFTQVRDGHRDVFDEHERITAGDREIATIVSEIQDFRFLPEQDSDEIYDVVGAAYEVYIGSHLKGDRGQYFTHRLVVGLLVRLVNPSERDVILDPAMGSGGFLIWAMRHIGRRIIASNRSEAAKRAAVTSVYQHLFGIDKSSKLLKVARTNMILASDGHSGLLKGDSLELLTKFPQDFRARAGIGKPTVILTNPPFGATTEHKITPATDPELLSQYEVAHVWRPERGVLQPGRDLITEGVPPEYLFVERCIKWVAPGGKIGVVVPRGLLDNDKAFALRTLITRECRIVAVVNCHDDTFKPHTDAKAALLILERRTTDEKSTDGPHSIFMAISQSIGHNGVGEAVYRTDARGDVVLIDGSPVLEQDSDEIFEAWEALGRGEASSSDYYFQITSTDLTENLNLNPVRYLPRYAESRRRVLELGEKTGWSVEHLGQIAAVFNGPRFKRPYAEKGVTSGPGVVRYFTGNAVTQTRGENVKYLDLGRAKPVQIKMIEKLYLDRGMLLITDSGTVGRVIYATEYHHGAIGTNNLIRVVIEDDALRGFVYQFLLSRLGQDQLKANIYGAIVDHIEPDDVRRVLIPVPTDRASLERIGLPVIRSIELQEQAQAELDHSEAALIASYDREPIETANDEQGEPTPFDRFKSLTKQLLAVPKDAITED